MKFFPYLCTRFQNYYKIVAGEYNEKLPQRYKKVLKYTNKNAKKIIIFIAMKKPRLITAVIFLTILVAVVTGTAVAWAKEGAPFLSILAEIVMYSVMIIAIWGTVDSKFHD